jgi:hypothetical protein
VPSPGTPRRRRQPTSVSESTPRAHLLTVSESWPVTASRPARWWQWDCPVAARVSARVLAGQGRHPLAGCGLGEPMQSPAVSTTWAWCMSRPVRRTADLAMAAGPRRLEPGHRRRVAGVSPSTTRPTARCWPCGGDRVGPPDSCPPPHRPSLTGWRPRAPLLGPRPRRTERDLLALEVRYTSWYTSQVHLHYEQARGGPIRATMASGQNSSC